jgi:hypothetical protein
MDDVVNIIEICQPLEYSKSHLPDDFNIDRSDLLVRAVERSLVHELGTNTDIGICYVGAIKRDNIFRVAVMHNLQFAQDLLAH